MSLLKRRLRSQHRGIVRDFVIEWYADEQGEIFCRTSHVFIRRVEREPTIVGGIPQQRRLPNCQENQTQENAQLRALTRRVAAG